MALIPLTIDDALDQILGKVKELLTAATEAGESLEGIKIVRGDRARPNPGYSSVWIVPDVATVNITTHGLAELWDFPIILGAIVKNTEPDAGYMEATALAAKAQQVLLGRNRRWGLDFIEHVTPLRFDPSSPRTSNQKLSLFWADAVVNVRFRRLEPSG